MLKAEECALNEWNVALTSYQHTTQAINEDPENWRPLIEAIHEILNIGLGDKIVFGLDHSYISESRLFLVATFMPSPQFLYMFSYILPAFKKMDLTEKEEEAKMLKNPKRIIQFNENTLFYVD